MTRQPVAAAKLERIAEILEDEQRLVSMPRDGRPAEASLDELRECSGACIRSVIDAGGSVAAVKSGTKLPSERFEDGDHVTPSARGAGVVERSAVSGGSKNAFVNAVDAIDDDATCEALEIVFEILTGTEVAEFAAADAGEGNEDR